MLECFSIKGAQYSSVRPGYTVDSKIIISFFLRYFDIRIQAFFKYDKFGLLFLSIGVGRVTIYTCESLMSFSLEVYLIF